MQMQEQPSGESERLAREQLLMTALAKATDHLLGPVAALPQELDPQQAVLGAILRQDGASVFGGAVRDALLATSAKDLDIALTAVAAVPHTQRAKHVADCALEHLNTLSGAGAQWCVTISTSKQSENTMPTAQQLQRPELTLLLLELGQDGQPQVS
jgi:Poly A polymerase head domain